MKQFDEGDLNSSGAVDGTDTNLYIDDFLNTTAAFAAWPECGGGSESLMGGGGEAMMAAGAMSEAQRRASLAKDLRAAIDSYIKRFGTPDGERLAELYDSIEDLEASHRAGRRRRQRHTTRDFAGNRRRHVRRDGYTRRAASASRKSCACSCRRWYGLDADRELDRLGAALPNDEGRLARVGVRAETSRPSGGRKRRRAC